MTVLYPTRRFLKGPVPMHWLNLAGRLPGKSLHAAIVCWHLAGLTKSETVKFSYKMLLDIGVGRHAGYRALKCLEHEKLIAVVRQTGCSPVVTILKGSL